MDSFMLEVMHMGVRSNRKELPPEIEWLGRRLRLIHWKRRHFSARIHINGNFISNSPEKLLLFRWYGMNPVFAVKLQKLKAHEFIETTEI